MLRANANPNQDVSRKVQSATVEQMIQIASLAVEIQPYTDIILLNYSHNMLAVSNTMYIMKPEGLEGVAKIVTDIIFFIPHTIMHINRTMLDYGMLSPDNNPLNLSLEMQNTVNVLKVSALLYINTMLLLNVSKPILKAICDKLDFFPNNKLIKKYNELGLIFKNSSLTFQEAENVINQLQCWRSNAFHHTVDTMAVGIVLDMFHVAIANIMGLSRGPVTSFMNIFYSAGRMAMRLSSFAKFFFTDTNKEAKNYHRFFENLITDELKHYHLFGEVIVEDVAQNKSIFVLKIGVNQNKKIAHLLRFIFEQIGVETLSVNNTIYIYFSREQAETNMKKTELIHAHFSEAVTKAIDYYKRYAAIDSNKVLSNLSKYGLIIDAESWRVEEEASAPEQCMGDKQYVLTLEREQLSDCDVLLPLFDNYFINEAEEAGQAQLHFFINSADTVIKLADFISHQAVAQQLRNTWIPKLAELSKSAIGKYQLDIDQDSGNYVISGPMKKNTLTNLLNIKGLSFNFATTPQKITIHHATKLDRIINLAAHLSTSAPCYVGISSSPLSFHHVKPVHKNEHHPAAASTSGSSFALLPLPVINYSISLNGVKKSISANEMLTVYSNHGFNGYRLIYWSQEIKQKLETHLGSDHAILTSLRDTNHIPAVGPRGEFGVVLCKNVHNGYINGRPVSFKVKIKGPGEDRVFLSPCTFFIKVGEQETVRTGLIPTAIGKHNSPFRALT